jgi:peptide chain release factor 1
MKHVYPNLQSYDDYSAVFLQARRQFEANPNDTIWSDLLADANQERIDSQGRLRNGASDLIRALAQRVFGSDDRVIVEISGSANAREASEVVPDLQAMYISYAKIRHWSVEIQEDARAEGAVSSTLVISGAGVYAELALETGTHKFEIFQRLMGTSARHRHKIQTRKADVVVLRDPAPSQFPEFKEADLDLNFSRSSGPGGQNVNKRDTAVEVIHRPTGLRERSQSARLQEQNRRIATERLRARVYEFYMQQRAQAAVGVRSSSVSVANLRRRAFVRTYDLAKHAREADQWLDGDLSDSIADNLRIVFIDILPRLILGESVLPGKNP